YIHAKYEVILAGGAFNSPQLLMLSGIGDKNVLNNYDIECISNRPGVGKNLQDRYEATVISQLSSNYTLLNGCKVGEVENDPCFSDYLKDTAHHVYGTNGVVAAVKKRSNPTKSHPDLVIFALSGFFKGYEIGWSARAPQADKMTWAVLKG